MWLPMLLRLNPLRPTLRQKRRAGVLAAWVLLYLPLMVPVLLAYCLWRWVPVRLMVACLAADFLNDWYGVNYDE